MDDKQVSALIEPTPPASAGVLQGVTVVIPAFNEDRFIGSVVIKARRQAATVLVVDDGSSDATAAVAEAAGAVVLRQPENRGKGTALAAGISAARQRGAEVVVLMDADGQHNPDEIPLLVAGVREGADIVIGSRFLQGKPQAPRYRRVGQRIVTWVTNWTSGVRVTDSWSGFRALSRRALEHISLRETGWGAEPEWQFQARQHGLVMREVPVEVVYREAAKRNPVKHGAQTLGGIVRLVGRNRPLVLFWSCGLAGVAVGVAAGVWVINRYLQLKVLAGGIALLSVSLVILGVLTVYTALILSFLQARFGEPRSNER